MAENYDLIFGQSASSQYAWSNSDYQNGWKTVGSTPPTAEQFDALQRRSDTKAKDLNNRLSPLETTASKALAKVTPAANMLPYFNSSNSATTTAISNFTKTLLDDKDAATARATLGAPSTTGANASGSWNINAATATKLATPRKINITGNASGSANFDGSGDVSINTTVSQAANADKVDGIHATSLFYNKGDWDADNWATIGAYEVSQNRVVPDAYDYGQVVSSSTNNTRFQLYSTDYYRGNGRLYYRTGWADRKGDWTTILDSENYNLFAPTKTGGGASGTWGIDISGNAATATKATSATTAAACSGNAASATKLQTARKIGGVSFDGTADITLPGVNTKGNQDTSGNAATATKATNATTAAACSGNSATATKLATARKIGGVSFDGSADITLPGVNTKGNQDTSGNAATATKLATPRTISLTGNASGSANFDGSGNVSINTTVSQAANADKVDGIHATSLFYNKGNWDADNWETIGTYEVDRNPPVSGAYGWGQVISSSTDHDRFQLYAAHRFEGTGHLYYRTGFGNEKEPWNTILDSENYNLFAPTKTGGGASGTWGINISGNADTVDGYHASDIINLISAANTGGIVAASLTTNGYVKFANGFIIQWGSHSNSNPHSSWYHYTFPIAFSTVFDVIDGYSAEGTDSFYGYSNNITNTGFDMYIDNSETGRYIAIGI